MRLSELASLLGGRVVGEGDPEVNRVAPIETAGPGDVTFLANPRYFSYLETTRADAVLVMEGIEAPGKRLVQLANPYEAFGKAVEILMVRPLRRFGVHAHATVDPTAELAENVSVGPGARIGAGVRIGRNSVVEANVVVYDDVTIGDDCVVHAGCVLRDGVRLGNRVVLQPNVSVGGDGFGFAPGEDGFRKIPQVGGVVLEDDVEIGAGCTIDRGALDDTVIGKGTKLDNLVMIAHGVRIGSHNVIAAQTGIAGSTTVGNGCMFGGQVGVVGHLKIGNGVKLAAKTGVMTSLPDATEWGGAPAIPHRQWLRASGAYAKLPEIRRRVAALLRDRDE